MLLNRWMILVFTTVTAISLAGCSKSPTGSRDPWADYLTAQEVWKNERAMLEDFERLHPTSPTKEEQAVLEMLKTRFDKASKHVKVCRQNLPDE